MTTSAIADWKELASRGLLALVVSLFWSPAANQIQVAVVDERLDEELHLDVPGACALDAFHHPFAYAAVEGLGFGYGTRRSSLARPSSALSRQLTRRALASRAARSRFWTTASVNRQQRRS